MGSDNDVQTNVAASVEELLEECGFGFISSADETPNNLLESALNQLATRSSSASPVRKAVVRVAAIRHLKGVGYSDARALVTAALRDEDKSAKALPATSTNEELEPWDEPVSGSELFGDIKGWLSQYIYASEAAIVGITLWVVATWFVSILYFAPILTLLSATKRTGKSLVFDLLRWICKTPYLTSGVGITSAVVFRLNQQRQPSLLIDEGEKLSGPDGREIVGLLNQ